ncbi:MAG: ArsA family ATPase [Acidobacteria bacterium]|nr:ArsA family ATPase [Acidobacteriota bacterium]
MKVRAFFKIPDTPFLFFGGKGGVGKTTIAAATAVLLFTQQKNDDDMLIFSTDPAHSLSDVFQKEIGDRLVAITQRGSSQLFAYEMDTASAFESFRREYQPLFQELASRGTLLDERDLAGLLELSLPGMDEIMALFTLSDLADSRRYRRLVIDTAPTGHTLRLVQLPVMAAQWLGALDRLAEKHRYMVRQFGRSSLVEDPTEELLRRLAGRVQRIQQVMSSESKASFILVTTSELMSLEETRRYLEALAQSGVKVKQLLVNRVEVPLPGCGFCQSRAAIQSKGLEILKEQFPDLLKHFVPIWDRDLRGRTVLLRFGRAVWSRRGLSVSSPRGHLPQSKRSSGSPVVEMNTRSEAGDFRFGQQMVLIFGGKGGVGKTSAAAAAALTLARSFPEQKVLVFSTDPAHSLTDSFDESVGQFKKGIARQSNLDGMEIDPQARLERFGTLYRAWLDKVFEADQQSTWKLQFERESMQELIKLVPPGLDEITAVGAILDLLEEGSYQRIVLDTAPTGHMIRFLELPEIALSWVKALMRLFLKYRELLRDSDLGEELVLLSRNLKSFQLLLRRPQRCEFVAVAIAEELSLQETLRLISRLQGLQIPVRRILVNNLVPPGAAKSCSFCASRRSVQKGVLARYRKILKEKVELFTAPQHPHEVRGRQKLLHHFSSWRTV